MHGNGAPAWLTLNDWPAMSNVPERALVLVLASTVKVAAPLPVPLLLVWIQLSELLAVQLHPVPAASVTLALPEPPEAAKEALNRVMV